jgi:hypothetical protein
MVVGASLIGLVLLAAFSLQEFAFTDYETEALPAIQRLLEGDVSGFLSAMPAYGGALVLTSPAALAGAPIGADHDLWAWRAQAVPGLAILGLLAVHGGRRVSTVFGGRGGVLWGVSAALFIAGAPFAMVAYEYGHAEELLVSGMAVCAVLLASRGNVGAAAVLGGLAAGSKPWAVIALPVILLAAHDRRSAVRAALLAGVSAVAILTPGFIAGGTDIVRGTAVTANGGVFRPDNVFWFAGPTNPHWNPDGAPAAATQRGGGLVPPAVADLPASALWAQRLEPAWVGRVSHPAVVVSAVLFAVAFWRRRPQIERRSDLLLVLSGVCWWRCLLDTWNVHYYVLASLLALALWETDRGRPPIVAIAATATAWTSLQIYPASSSTPDLHTALYLGWAVPFGCGLLLRACYPAAFARVADRCISPWAARLPTLAAAAGRPADGRERRD